ncbi:PKD domain-containing protein, partial [Algibacter sp.]|nr:PKD domain-containing protein [Algibacter sp.]
YYDWDLTGVTGDNLQIWVEFNSDDNDDYHGIGNVKLSGTLAPVVTPDADFSADNTTPDTGNIVTFTDLSTNIPTSWAWTFSNPGNVTYVNGTSASSQNPQVTFSTAGNYSVTLNATNASGTNGEIKTDYITVSTNENPTSFTVSQSSTNPYTFLDLNATANTSNDNIIVAYNTTNTFGTPTTDASNTIILNGGGSIIFEGNANAIASNSLPQLDQNTTYYFKAWSIMSTGFSSGIEADATTAAVAAPVSLVVTASDINNSITFSAAANSLNDNLMLVYNTSDDFGTPEDGVLYQIDDLIGNATVLTNSVNIESINNYIHDFLQLNTDYYYRIYSVATGIWYYSDSYRANDDQTIEGFIWQNDIQGSNPNQQNPYTTGDQVNSNIVVSGISRGTGLTGVNDDNDYKAEGWSESSSLNTANNDYFEFILTPDSGYEINFEEFFYNAKDDRGNVDVALRSSIDDYASNIGDRVLDGDDDTSFDLTGDEFQNISEAITFRIYGWNASDDDIQFKIESFGIKGTLSEYCTWNGTSWSKVPDLGIKVTLNGDYNTSIGGEQTSFRCKSLKVNSGKTLTVDNETFVEVNYNVTVNGNIVVETKGAFIQRDNDGVFSVNGTSQVNKSTPYKDQWYHYTYWSSPVVNMNIEAAFPNINRKFYFDGAAWQYATGQTMDAGKGYITTASAAGIQTASFVGEFNTGTITTPLYYDAAKDENWNLIGNPYPSSIDLNQFLGTNSAAIEGAAYFWSQETPPEGGQFSGSDYIPFNATGSVSSSSDPLRAVNGFTPSGQSFFIKTKAAGNASFTNAMRMADATSNTQFFKNSNSVPPKGSTENANKLWVNLSSDHGIFSQILIGYIDGATNLDDGLIYDAMKFDEGSGTFLYSTIEDSNSKFVIQAKDVNSINADEIIPIGFKAEVAAAYSISIAKLQGDFLNNNTLFLKDKLNNITYDLSASDYSFTSEVGEFNSRFEIVFNANALSTNDVTLNSKSLRIIELEDDRVQFTASNNLSIKTVTIFDLLGRQLYRFKGTNSSEIYKLSHLSSAVFIAKVELSNGVIITKKALKR